MKCQLYNFNDLTSDREWLYNLLLSDTDTDTEISDEDDYLKEMMKAHIRERKLREKYYTKPSVFIIYLVLSLSLGTNFIAFCRIRSMPTMAVACFPPPTCIPIISNRLLVCANANAEPKRRNL